MRFVKGLLGLTALLLILASPGFGAEAPLLDTRTLTGEKQDLDKYVGKGKWTLVMFWATDCHICKQQKPEISRFHNEHKNLDAQVVGVAIDGMANKAAIQAYVYEHSPSFPTLVAELPVLAMNYYAVTEENFRGTPTYWLFSPKGELLGNNPGPLRVEAIEAFMAKYRS